MGTITDLLKKRFSTRRYRPEPIPRAVIDEILEAGRLSPSGGNQQPWRFGVITNPQLIAHIAQLAHHQTWVERAPLLIVLCTQYISDEAGGRDIQIQRYPEYAGDITRMDQNLYWALNQEEHQTKIAGTHMALAAWEHQVGSCWISRFEVRAVAELLHLPANVWPAEILAFGYPEGEPHLASKKDMGEIAFFLE